MDIMECFSVDESYEKDYNEWLSQYLLDLEARNKNPPNSTFSGQIGRFSIPFQTEKMGEDQQNRFILFQTICIAYFK